MICMAMLLNGVQTSMEVIQEVDSEILVVRQKANIGFFAEAAGIISRAIVARPIVIEHFHMNETIGKDFEL